MIVYTSPTTPFGRKVRMVAIEKGVDGKIDWRNVDPWTDPFVGTKNPLGKVPALELADGTVLFDSSVIVEYLDVHTVGLPLLPADGPRRWKCLALQALADGILDAAVAARIEGRRPETLRSADWVERQHTTMERGLAALESESESFGETPNLGTLATSALLGYLDFRYPELDWHSRCPRLSAWHKAFSTRPSYLSTEPPEA
jgi:glutathione S-transferase